MAFLKIIPSFCSMNLKSISLVLPGGSDAKESAYNAGDLGLIPTLGRSPGEGHGNPLQYSCLKNPPGQRNLVGYSPWGHNELDTTELLSRRRQWQPTPVLLPGNSHGWRSLVGCSPWGR